MSDISTPTFSDEITAEVASQKTHAGLSQVERDHAERDAYAGRKEVALGINARFFVSVGNLSLGAWKSCKGLSVTFESEPLYEGGNYESPAAMLAKQLKYNTITLQRAMHPVDSAAVQKWLKDRARSWMHQWWDINDQVWPGDTMAITLGDSSMHAVATWNLNGVYPSKWSGPEMDAMGSGAVALETLELVHKGFLM
ncbi:phage tail protein [Streptacidiphilus rugosus]|uniref:phage tail protein n=1 Tax=Streptacidiphilus rugosus TaxID=405783 RepID=UPI00056D4468|nr:phage tail protein [Streptacidiphilus rugosus]